MDWHCIDLNRATTTDVRKKLPKRVEQSVLDQNT